MKRLSHWTGPPGKLPNIPCFFLSNIELSEYLPIYLSGFAFALLQGPPNHFFSHTLYCCLHAFLEGFAPVPKPTAMDPRKMVFPRTTSGEQKPPWEH